MVCNTQSMLWPILPRMVSARCLSCGPPACRVDMPACTDIEAATGSSGRRRWVSVSSTSLRTGASTQKPLRPAAPDDDQPALHVPARRRGCSSGDVHSGGGCSADCLLGPIGKAVCCQADSAVSDHGKCENQRLAMGIQVTVKP